MLCVPATSVAAEPLGPGAGYERATGSHPVRELQRTLHRVGSDPGRVDGLYGPLTRAAVVRIQLGAGLEPDGVVGPETRATLAAAETGRSLDVRALQRRLRGLGQNPGPVDGVYGPLTRAAVERFQRVEGLAVDGIVGPQTTRRLLRERPEPLAAPRVRIPHLPPAAPASGARGGDVAEPATPGGEPSSGLAPEYALLLAVFGAACVLGGLRAFRARLSTGMACAGLLAMFALGAAGGALFVRQAAPDSGARVSDAPLRATPPMRRVPPLELRDLIALQTSSRLVPGEGMRIP
jgi:Putative peptidoglycan binding domain